MTAAKLVVITGGLALHVPVTDCRKLIKVEKYLARQARAAHNLGIRDLERFYNIAFLSLRTWRIATLESREAAPWIG